MPASSIDIRLAWQTGTPLGDDRFRIQIERTLKTRVEHSKRGRPRKPHANSGNGEEKQLSLLNRQMSRRLLRSLRVAGGDATERGARDVIRLLEKYGMLL